MGKVVGICISEKRGTKKTPLPEADIVEGWGIERDAHGGNWHRQVSLLPYEKIEAFRERGAEVAQGDFGENIIVQGIDLKNLPLGARININKAVLELTQVGKECHSHCEIYQSMGDCIMPREGVFARVVAGGHIRVGDRVEVILPAGSENGKDKIMKDKGGKK